MQVEARKVGFIVRPYRWPPVRSRPHLPPQIPGTPDAWRNDSHTPSSDLRIANLPSSRSFSDLAIVNRLNRAIALRTPEPGSTSDKAMFHQLRISSFCFANQPLAASQKLVSR